MIVGATARQTIMERCQNEPPTYLAAADAQGEIDHSRTSRETPIHPNDAPFQLWQYLHLILYQRDQIMNALRDDQSDLDLAPRIEDVKHNGGRFPVGKVITLRHEWIQSDELYSLYRETIAEAALAGMDGVLLPKLETMNRVHDAFLDAVKCDYENEVHFLKASGAHKRAILPHSEAVLALDALLPAVAAKLKGVAATGHLAHQADESGANKQKQTGNFIVAGKIDADAEVVQYVTLDQMAARVNRSKKSLEKKLNAKNSTMPKPDVKGKGGKPHEWIWAKTRPWLETEFGKQLPTNWPSRRADGN